MRQIGLTKFSLRFPFIKFRMRVVGRCASDRATAPGIWGKWTQCSFFLSFFTHKCSVCIKSSFLGCSFGTKIKAPIRHKRWKTWYFIQFIIKAKVCKVEVCFKHSVEAYVFKYILQDANRCESNRILWSFQVNRNYHPCSLYNIQQRH